MDGTLYKYPRNDPFDTFEGPGRRMTRNLGVGELILDSGETVVYFHQEREGNRVVDTLLGFRHAFDHGIMVCGYRVEPKGLLRIFKSPKIRPIPSGSMERAAVKVKVAKRFPQYSDYVEFWN